MSYEIKGKIHKIFDTQQVTDSFKKREFVIEAQDGNYAQFVKLQLTQDRCDLMDAHNEGQEVNVFFNITGKEYMKNGEAIYFTNLNAWRITAESPQSGVGNSQGEDFGFPSEEPAESDFSSSDNGDLPF